MRRLVCVLLLLSSLAAAAVAAPLRGMVAAADGSPISGVRVTATAPETLEQRMLRYASASPEAKPLGSVVSASDGEFTIDATGNWIDLRFERTGYAPAFVATPSGTDVGAVILRRSESRRGRVTADGKPLSGALIVVRGEAGELLQTSAADGSFNVPDTGGWANSLQVHHRDHPPMAIVFDEGRPLPNTVELKSGTRWKGVVVSSAGVSSPGVTLYVGPAPHAVTNEKGEFDFKVDASNDARIWAAASGQFGMLATVGSAARIKLAPAVTLSGTVRDHGTRKVLPGARVRAFGESIVRETFTDPKGQYRLEVPSGQYQLWPELPAYAPELSSPGTYSVDVRGGRGVVRDLALAPVTWLRGKAVDGRREGVAGVLVSIPIPAHGTQRDVAVTDGSGRFRLAIEPQLARMLARGDDTTIPVNARKKGFAPVSVALSGEQLGRELVIEVAPGIGVTGLVAAANGEPVVDATVEVTPRGPRSGWNRTGFIDPLVSDAAGKVTTWLAEGSYNIAVQAAGFVSVQNQLLQVISGRKPDFDVKLERGVAAGGRVLHADGEPVRGATVAVRGDDEAMDQTVTDDAGHFEFDGLRAGTYLLAVFDAEFSINESATVTFPKADLVVTVAPGQALSGRVIDSATKAPIVVYSIFPEAESTHESMMPLQVSDAEGRFTFPRLQKGTWTLELRADGYVPLKRSEVVIGDEAPAALEIALEPGAELRGMVRDESSGSPLEAVSVSVESEQSEVYHEGTTTTTGGEFVVAGVPRTQVRLRFTKDGWVSRAEAVDAATAGTLEVKLSTGLRLRGVVTAGGRPVAEAYVYARSAGSDGSGSSGRSDASGRFTLAGLVPGRVTVMATREGYMRAEMTDVDPSADREVLLELEKMESGTIRGRLLGADASQYPQRGVMAATDHGSASAEIDEQGGFVLDKAPAGEVRVTARLSSGGVSLTARERKVTLEPGGDVTVDLTVDRGVAVEGIVRRDGEPMVQASVSFSSPSGEGYFSAQTNGVGHYEVVGMPPGRYSVRVDAMSLRDGYETSTVVKEAQRFDIDIRSIVVRGRVVTSSEVPLRDAVVNLTRLEAVGGTSLHQYAEQRSDSRGAFTLGLLSDGRYRVVAAKKDFAPRLVEFDVREGAAPDLELRLERAGGSRIRLVDGRDGRSLSGEIVVRDTSRRVIFSGDEQFDEAGFSSIALESGDYLVSASATGYASLTIRMRAPSPSTTLSLTPGGHLVINSPRDLRGEVRLVRPDGEEYVRCWCNGIAPIELRGQTTRIENIEPGSYAVRITDLDGASLDAGRVSIVEGQTSTLNVE